MKALLFDGGLSFTREHPLPKRRGGESLVRVLVAGICNTDLEILRGYMGFRGVPGHEFVGLVEESSNDALLGRRVVGEISCPCGACPLCRRGLGKHCPNRTVLGIKGRDGAFAEYLVIPDVNLHLVPEGLPNEEAVFTEPLAAAYEIIESVHIRPEDRVIVVGAGKLGRLVAQVLRGTGCRLSVTVRRQQDSDFLALCGIEGVGMEELPSHQPFDIVVECSGAPEGFEAALRSVRPRGTIVQKSTYAGLLELDISSLVVDEVRIVGSRCGPFAPALRALASGAVAVRSLIERVLPFDDAVDAFAMARDALGKIILKM